MGSIFLTNNNGFVPTSYRYSVCANIKKVIFNPRATVIIFKDGSKSIVKLFEGDEYDKEKGFAMALLKSILGESAYKAAFKQWVKKGE